LGIGLSRRRTYPDSQNSVLARQGRDLCGWLRGDISTFRAEVEIPDGGPFPPPLPAGRRERLLHLGPHRYLRWELTRPRRTREDAKEIPRMADDGREFAAIYANALSGLLSRSPRHPVKIDGRTRPRRWSDGARPASRRSATRNQVLFARNAESGKRALETCPRRVVNGKTDPPEGRRQANCRTGLTSGTKPREVTTSFLSPALAGRGTRGLSFEPRTPAFLYSCRAHFPERARASASRGRGQIRRLRSQSLSVMSETRLPYRCPDASRKIRGTSAACFLDRRSAIYTVLSIYPLVRDDWRSRPTRAARSGAPAFRRALPILKALLGDALWSKAVSGTPSATI